MKHLAKTLAGPFIPLASGKDLRGYLHAVARLVRGGSTSRCNRRTPNCPPSPSSQQPRVQFPSEGPCHSLPGQELPGTPTPSAVAQATIPADSWRQVPPHLRATAASRRGFAAWSFRAGMRTPKTRLSSTDAPAAVPPAMPSGSASPSLASNPSRQPKDSGPA